MIEIVAAMLCMAFQDVCGTALTICEARGRALLAATWDALGDWPKVLGGGIVGSTMTQHGVAALCVMACAVSCTSFVSTGLTTRVARRIKTDG